MKLSVSVPDELWERARAALGEDGPSQVIQTALRRIAESPTFSDRFEGALPDIGQNRVERIRDKLLHQARETWKRGYDDALDLAETISWDALESFGETANFDLRQWVWKVRGSEGDVDAVWRALAKHAQDGSLITDNDGDPVPRQLPRAYREGYEKALGDVWRAVVDANEPAAEIEFPTGADDDIPF